ncbi:MAG: T9SS type A sorting domain-containing protein, partial [Sphingobacteriales bacterium]
LTTTSNNKLPGAQVNSVTKDLNGAIWVGTINGVAAYSSPSQIMSPNYNIDPRPRIDERYLLENQIVLDIAVDGGNRKWIATETGLWLFNESGNEMLQHFTAENSPLPSNKVTKLAINQQNGELFIATEQGLVSYREGATMAETTNTCNGVFPNPVRPGFTGTVGISGVPANATVKITDLAGVLVLEVKANGNTATWNLNDYNGHRVQSGVYLLLAASADGTQEYMCKVAVLD